MSDAQSRGRFVWYDLMTTEPDNAIGFYTKVAGWGTSKWEGPTPYTMWTNAGVPMGGVMELRAAPGIPPHWLGYISTPDIDKTVKQTSDLGGRVIVPPTDIPTVGRFAVLHDPQGASFAAFTPETRPPTAHATMKAGEFSWHELATKEQPAAFRFYEILFGWQKSTAMDMGEAGTYQIFSVGGVDLGGIYDKPRDMPDPPSWLYYIHVPELQRVVDTVMSNDGQVVNGPMEVPGGGWIAQCMDPQGGMFALHSQNKG